MGVLHYNRKPTTSSETITVAKYEPGQPLAALAEVARMAYTGSELAEVTFPSGPVLVVRWMDIPDDHPSTVKYETVEPGDYLAYSAGSGFLYDTDDADLQAFYEQAAAPDTEE